MLASGAADMGTDVMLCVVADLDQAAGANNGNNRMSGMDILVWTFRRPIIR
jgi:hypothetical protein